jgi:hypothetical protein
VIPAPSLPRLYPETVFGLAEIWRDGKLLGAPEVVAGTVTCDVTRAPERSCDVTVIDTLGVTLPAGSELRLWRVSVDRHGGPDVALLGRFIWADTDVERSGSEVRIGGHDAARLVTMNRWEGPYLVQSGVAHPVAAATAVQDRLPGWAWMGARLDPTSARTRQPVWGEEREHDPWDDVRGLARAVGMRPLFARDWTLLVARDPDPAAGPARWQWTAGHTPQYLDGVRKVSGWPYNVVVATGEPVYEQDEDTVPPPPVVGVAEDTDPASPSWAGRYRRPYFLTSQLIATQQQADDAAAAQLARVVGLSEEVTCQVVTDHLLDVLQTVRLRDRKIGADGLYLTEAVTVPVGPGPSTVSMARRRLVDV